MHGREHPTTQTIDAVEALRRWSSLLSGVSRQQVRIVVEEDGIPVAALISPQDLARFNRLEAERTARFAVIDRIRDAFKGVPADELEREIPSAVEEARAELRAGREQTAEPA